MASTGTTEVRAQAKWVRVSPRKARLVVEHIRGRTVPEARAVLAFTARAAAREVEKVLRSAVANAEANHGLVGEELFVAGAVVDEGPMLKRWRARARGRVGRIRRRTCHITVLLAPLAGAAGAGGGGEETRLRRGRRPLPAGAGKKAEGRAGEERAKGRDRRSRATPKAAAADTTEEASD